MTAVYALPIIFFSISRLYLYLSPLSLSQEGIYLNDTVAKGLVIRAQSGFFTIRTEQGDVTSKIPKRIRYQKRKNQETQNELASAIVAVGDQVTVRVNEDGTGTIEHVEPRRSVLSRARPSARARQVRHDVEQVLVANPDQVVLVFSIRDPEPSIRKLDRFLTVTEMNDLPTIICVNKVDLVSQKDAEQLFGVYEQIGYTVIYTSAETGEGVATLRQHLNGKMTVLTGSSGVGKSSLLNALQPGLQLQVAAVSDATTKGMHTTRFTQLIPLEGKGGGYIADTPGIRGLALFNLEPEELDGYFIEIAPLVAACDFSNCSHRHEPGCAVRRAVAAGDVSAARYDSYLRLREEHELLNQKAY